ncbi:Crp/Fnr family transcriptional regulator [Algoriphagus halophytocola]|uniref:Crp/Fnr family transcriptional regulator n=1 Tax=Algoriphagus halophytocola TaxID=2991499 RepID=A0ABY6MGF9_9BACT|nr:MULTISPECIES: Crp/Fnr family transcriptional regulator [unclassified Algoriphagus]UZD22877.1 Crp/Fnr family transcriptional regulator [Algoriphagus sp. TR-M5]WBL44144.1 Crp/Fnr family transcriptional regulator [Algoriphagus sp. TR-M9]
MSQALVEHIQKFIPLTPYLSLSIPEYFQRLEVGKKGVLQPANQLCDHLFFVERGCVHAFFVDQRGVEKSIQFALENWWITDYQAFYKKKVTDATIQAVEESVAWSISRENYTALLRNHPELESYFRQMYEIGYGAMLTRLKYLFNYSKEEIFYSFSEQFPYFVQRVPQYILATYLGLTPEYLSKLRSKKRS